MSTQELYLRNATETEARGPFNVQQVADLADAGHVTPDTLIYDATAEQWVALSSKEELVASIFPPKRKLELKPKEITGLNTADAGAKAISVTDMLDAAEGRTAETRGKGDPAIAMMRAARVGMIAATITLVFAAAAEALPHTAALMSMSGPALLANPLAVLGAIDLFLAIMLALGVTALYPLIRFRAALGLGFIGFIFYAQGVSSELMLAVAVGSIGLYACTLVVSMVPAILAGLAGVGGMGLLAWRFLT